MILKTFFGWIGAMCALVALRYILTGELHYLFIVWNMILAAAPLWIESLMRAAGERWKGWRVGAASVFLAGAWLMLLPNAFYILTDFSHQNSDVVVNMRNDEYFGGIYYSRGDAIFAFDSLLIFVATVFGAYCGGVALLHAYTFLKKYSSKEIAYTMLGGIMMLSSIGVYIGRYGRWNSWDVLYRPFYIMGDFLHQFLSAESRERIFITTVTMVVFQIFSLYGVYWIYKERLKNPVVSDGK